MACITIKYQKCGKENCRCHTGFLHGPYFWLISYKRGQAGHRGRYKWTYLGKGGENTITFLKNHSITKKWSSENWKRFCDKIKFIEIKGLQHNILKKNIVLVEDNNEFSF